MDPRIVLFFVTSSIDVVKKNSALELYKKKISIKRQKKIHKPVCVIIEFHEELKGYIIYEFDRGLSVRIVDNMAREVYGKGVNEMSTEEFKEAFEATIGELGNQISGVASTKLYEEDIKIRISSPLILINSEGKFISGKQYIEAILDTIYGEMFITILFDEFLDIEEIKKR